MKRTAIHVAGFDTTAQAEGAWRNGTRVEKRNSRRDDIHRDGAPGTVRGSIGAPGFGYGYFIEWDDLPGLPSFCASARLAKLEHH